MDIKPIRTEQDHAAALAEIERLMDLEPPTDSPDGDRLDVLATLVEVYEDRTFPFTPANPIAAIEMMMADKGLTRHDLEPIIGGRGRVSEVLNRRRKLSMEMIRGLSERLAIPVDILIQPYSLVPSGATPRRSRSHGHKRAA